MNNKTKSKNSAFGQARRNSPYKNHTNPRISGSGNLFLSRFPGYRRKCRNKRQWIESAEKASLTVEAAFAVPFFFLCMVTLICMMNMYGMVARKTVELQEKVEIAGMAAGAANVTKVPVIDMIVPAVYEPVWWPVPGQRKKVWLSCRGRVYAWVGRDPKKNTGEEEKKSEELVYVTETGKVYHTSARCTHISLSIQAVSSRSVPSMRNTGGARYHACEKCVKNDAPGETVYITSQGNRYHNSASCSGLTRNIRMVPVSEVKGMRKCSRCEELEKEEQQEAQEEKAG